MLIKVLVFSTIFCILLELKTEAVKSENVKNQFIKNEGKSRVVRSANNISQQLEIKPLEKRYTVNQGTDFELICDTTGTSNPTIIWSMSGGQLASNARQIGNVLKISNINADNNGVYICLATNNAEIDVFATVVEAKPVIQTSASFNGNSWLELDRNTIADSSRQLTSGIALMFSTNQSNGLLLWYGQNKGHEFNGEDFFSLAIKDGVLEFAFRLDGEESSIRHHGTRVDQNVRHIAMLKRTGDQAILELDGMPEYGETRPTLKKEMDLPGHIFLGGAPDMRRFTGDRHTQGFIGCIHIVEPITGGSIQLGEKAISSMNIEQCSYVDDEDSSETE